MADESVMTDVGWRRALANWRRLPGGRQRLPGGRPIVSVGEQPRHARQRPPRGHALVIAAALMVTVAAGLLIFRPWTSRNPQPAGRPGASGRESRGTRPLRGNLSAPAFAATGGPFCAQSSAIVTDPYHDPSGDGWHLGRSREGICGSQFLYSQLARVPGDPDQWQDDYDWTFNTDLAAPSCTLSFYIPVSAHANSRIYYWITAGSENSSNQIASFTIDQRAHQGQWVSRGPFRFPGGTVFTELTDRGEGPPAADAVAGPLSVTCRASPG